jgi:hypothetical protein
MDSCSCSSKAFDTGTGRDNCILADIDNSMASGRDSKSEADTILGSKVPDKTPGHQRPMRRIWKEIRKRAVPGSNFEIPFFNPPNNCNWYYSYFDDIKIMSREAPISKIFGLKIFRIILKI